MYEDGEVVQVLDEECGVWRSGTILTRESSNEYTIHYNGWSRRHDQKLSTQLIRPVVVEDNQAIRKRIAPGSRRLYKLPQYLVKDDEIYFIIDKQTDIQHGSVLVNDPFKGILSVSCTSANIVTELKYDAICPPPNTVSTISNQSSKPKKCKKPSKSSRRSIVKTLDASARNSKFKTSKANSTRKNQLEETLVYEHTTSHISGSSSRPTSNNMPTETAALVLNEQIITCGSFITTDVADVYLFVTHIQVYSQGKTTLSGYYVKSSGNAIYNLGKYQDLSIKDDAKIQKLNLDAHWKQRVISTAVAAEWRIANTCTGIDQVREMERCIQLKCFVLPQLQEAMGAKKRRVSVIVPYDNRIDGTLFGIDIANGFREVYFPLGFVKLDHVLGKQWDCRLLPLTARYAFITRLLVKLVSIKQHLEIVAHIVSPSLMDFREEYREDTMAHIVNSNRQFENIMKTGGDSIV